MAKDVVARVGAERFRLPLGVDGRRDSRPTAAPGTLSLLSTSIQTDEGTAFNLVLSRSGGSDGAVAVDWAIAGVTTAPQSGTVTWAEGDTANKPVAVTAGIVAETQAAAVTLSNARRTDGGQTQPVIGVGSGTLTVNDVQPPASWNLPATINIPQSGSVGLRQYTVNASGYTISVSGLPTGVTYNAGTESLVGASTGTGSATVTFTLTLGASVVQDTATVALAAPSEYPAGYYPSNYDLELVSPRAAGTAPSAESGTPNMPSGHRIFKAYPGIEYNIRAVVIGGAYPYTFALSNAPAGMTINSRTGEITWPNPQENAEPTITVTDMDGTQRSSSWAITVTTSGFRFVDSVSGSDANAGTLAAPWQTLTGVYNSSASTDITYFRSGTYDHGSLPITSEGGGWQRVEWPSSRSRQWIAFPGDSVSLDSRYNAGTGTGTLTRLSGDSTTPVYIDGLEAGNAGNIIFQLGQSHYNILRRLLLRDILNGQDGQNPAGVMYLTTHGVNPSYYGCLQDVEATALVGGGPFKTYSQYKWLCEDLNAHDTSWGADIKAATGRWEVRGSLFDRLTATYAGLFGNMNQDPASGLRNNGEVRFNKFLASGASNILLDVNQDGNSDQVDIYRNTFVGGIVRVRNVDSADGPFNFDSNVIVNESSETDNITLSSVSDSSRIVRTNNLSGGAADAITNTDGLLQGSYRTTYLNQRGHEIAES